MEDDCPPLLFGGDILDNKKGWSSEEKIQYIMELQEKGLSRKEIAVEFGYTRVDTLDSIMKIYFICGESLTAQNFLQICFIRGFA